MNPEKNINDRAHIRSAMKTKEKHSKEYLQAKEAKSYLVKNKGFNKSEVKSLELGYYISSSSRRQSRELSKYNEHLNANNRKTKNKRGVLSRLVVRQLIDDKILYLTRA